MYPSQTNTQQGVIPINSGVDLRDKEGYLVKLADAGDVPEVVLPTDEADVCQFVVVDGGNLDEVSHVQPLTAGAQVRIRANGTASSGDVAALATISTDAGKVEKLPADADDYFCPGYFEEDVADEQLALVRVFPREVTVS